MIFNGGWHSTERMRGFFSWLLVVSLMGFSGESLCGQMYKYKDKNGKWVFTDKKPSGEKDVDRLELKTQEKKTPKPSVYIENVDGQYRLTVHNPYHAPIDLEVRSSAFTGGTYRGVVQASTKKVLLDRKSSLPKFRYRWWLGDPAARDDGSLYAFPVSSLNSHKITQSFNGRFSHFQRPSIHAVDIATPVGTYISAARAGTVIWVKDDYHMGGRNQYFLDKANYVNVLHEDGTYAVYAHILLGSALVKPGDRVERGERLARAGSSGYSTGPHLHFVIKKNTGGMTVSVPFQFVDGSGRSFVPKRGMIVDGNREGVL